MFIVSKKLHFHPQDSILDFFFFFFFSIMWQGSPAPTSAENKVVDKPET